MRRIFIICVLITVSINTVFSLRKEFNFMGLKLGMSQQQTTNLLASQTNLIIDERLYLGKGINDAIPFIMKASFFPYINNVYIQFYSNVSYCIIVQFNPNYFDFLTLAETMEDRYGTPASRTSKEVFWQDALTNTAAPGPDIQLRLEYPSTVKIFDNTLMRAVNEESRREVTRVTNESIIQSNKRAILGEL